MPNNKYRVSGAVFENTRETGPAFTGFIEIDGVKTQFALWPKTSAKGIQYLQVAEDKKPAQAAAPKRPQIGGGRPQQAPQKPQLPDDDMDDSIPF